MIDDQTGEAGPGAIGGRRFVKWFGAFFILICIATLVFGYLIVKPVRGAAVTTDSALRTLGWELLRYAAAHQGHFPTSENEFIDGLRSAVDPPPSPKGLWPATEKDALLGQPPMVTADAIKAIKVTWSPRAELAPELSANGKPTLVSAGTVSTEELVRGWLHRWVDSHVPPPPKPPGG